MENAYGLDADYFNRLFARELKPDIVRNQTPTCLARVLLRAARTASEQVFAELEFSGLFPKPAEALAGITLSAEGEANTYRMMRGGNWLASIRMNGELLVSQQEAILSAMLASPPADHSADIDKMVSRFLSWPLPDSVCADGCASIPGYPLRYGTNLLNADQARAMLEHVLEQQDSAALSPADSGLVQVPRKVLADFIEYSVPGRYGVDEKWFADKQALVALVHAEPNAAQDGPLPDEPKPCRQCDESVGYVCENCAAQAAPVVPEDVRRMAFEAFAVEAYGPGSLELDGDGSYFWESTRNAFDVWRAAQAAQPAQADEVPDGWRLVPVEPTEAMILNESGCQHHAWDDKGCQARQIRFGVWAKMLAAAPQPAARQDRDEVRRLREALELAISEYEKLPHSLGYEFTHLPIMRAALSAQQLEGK